MSRSTTDTPRDGVATTVVQTEPPARPSRPSIPSLGSGTHVGRYVIERALGAGGMGVVYIAHDPALGRDVALKLLHEGAPSERLRREAQALARLDHRNVVAVHDVGEHDGRAFVAMALVDGENLRHWLGRPRPWREGLRVILAAGRGLAAAHGAGLIHRDLKPDNIFVSARGDVLVGDFGLARTVRDSEVEGSSLPAEAGMTLAGTLLGTPAYMAPEQAAGEATFASDQFALCATAWEALYGQRPFTGETTTQLLDAIARGELVPPRDERGVPRRVRRALERGLAVDPGARWPSVDALLAELARDRARVLRAIAVAVGAGTIVAAGTWMLVGSRAPGGRCPAAQDRLATTWTPAQAAEIRRAVAKVAPYATTSAEHAIAMLDAYAASWRDSWDQTCGATLTAADLDLRVACLDGRLHALGAAADALRTTDRDGARHLLDVVAALPSIDRCTDLTSMRKVAPPPPPLVTGVAIVERELVEGEALARAGRYTAADAVLRPARAQADALGYTPTRGRAELALAFLVNKQGHFTEAKPLAEAALNDAIACGDDELAARAYVRLAANAIGLADAPRARDLSATADAAVRRIGDPADLHARVVVTHAMLPLMTGDYAEALVRVTAAIDQLEKAKRPLDASSLYRARSALLAAAGRIDEARAVYDHEIDLDRELLGAAHPDLAEAYIARGSFARNSGRLADAIADYETGYNALVAALGDHDTIVLNAGAELAELDLVSGKYDDAIPTLRRAADANVAIGPQQEASARRTLAQALAGANKLDEADRELARASELDGKLDGPWLVSDQLLVAGLRFMQGRIDETQAMLDRVQPQAEKLFGTDSPALSDVWILRARVELARGHADRAVEWLARVKKGPNEADAKVVLARALARRGDRAGAAAARAAATELLDALGPTARPDLRAELITSR